MKVANYVNRFRGGLVFKAPGLVHHSTLGLRVIEKKKKKKLISKGIAQVFTTVRFSGLSDLWGVGGRGRLRSLNGFKRTVK